MSRFQTVVAVPPPDAAGTVHWRTTPVMVNGYRCMRPFQLGNVEVSIARTRTYSATLTDNVPKWAMLPATIARFSSGVPVTRLSEANMGRSARVVTIT